MCNRKISIKGLLLLGMFGSVSFSQIPGSIDYAKLVSVMNSTSKSAVFIETPEKYGTGTFFGIPFSDTSSVSAVLIATAKHVLSRTDSLGKEIGLYKTATATLMTTKGKKEVRKYELIYEAAKLDIAVLGPAETFRSFVEYDSYVPPLKDIASFLEIEKGLTTFIAGFPFKIGLTATTMNPVIQSGIIAYVDTLGSLVLIDIAVNLGNSGCPVYVATKEGVPKLLGLVFQYEPSREDVVFRATIARPVPANTSLGRVVLLKTIISDLKKMIQ